MFFVDRKKKKRSIITDQSKGAIVSLSTERATDDVVLCIPPACVLYDHSVALWCADDLS